MAFGRNLAAVLLTGALPTAALAGPCVQWRAPEKLGVLDGALISEASGIAASRTHPGRLYHNNDSGDGPFFYQTDAGGGATRRIAVSGFTPRDVEDIALGPCTGAPACLYLGDIGDNGRARSKVQFIQVAELAKFPGEVAPLRIVEARYPDGAHDAEGFALHPNGDLYLITKAVDFRQRASAPAQLFRLTVAQLDAPAGEVQTFEPVGTLDLPALISDAFASQAATAMDISADGARTLVLTYRTVLEWRQDLAQPIGTHALEPGRDFSLTPLHPLVQAEAIAYDAEGDAILYTSELTSPATEVPLYRQTCARR